MCAGHGGAGALPPGAADWDAGRAQEGGGSAAEETPHGERELATVHCSNCSLKIVYSAKVYEGQFFF